MAQLHNKAGQRLRAESRRRLMWLLMALTACGMLLGGGLVWFFTISASIPAITGGIIGGLLAWQSTSRVDDVFERWEHERMDQLRGARGEEFVGWLLEDLDDNWHIFHNVQLEKPWDIDHIAVGPGGIWCISTKSSRGLYSRGADGRFYYNNEESGLLGATRWQAVKLGERLKVLLGQVPWVHATLAVPFGFTQVRNPVDHVWVVHQEDLLRTIDTWEKEKLGAAEVGRIVEALEMLAKRSKEIYREAPREGARADDRAQTAPATARK